MFSIFFSNLIFNSRLEIANGDLQIDVCIPLSTESISAEHHFSWFADNDIGGKEVCAFNITVQEENEEETLPGWIVQILHVLINSSMSVIQSPMFLILKLMSTTYAYVPEAMLIYKGFSCHH